MHGGVRGHIGETMIHSHTECIVNRWLHPLPLSGFVGSGLGGKAGCLGIIGMSVGAVRETVSGRLHRHCPAMLWIPWRLRVELSCCQGCQWQGLFLMLIFRQSRGVELNPLYGLLLGLLTLHIPWHV